MNTNNKLNISEGGVVRSSTRIHAPPGGSSQAGSLIFGGGASQQPQQISSNKFATGTNQNCGNFMTGRSSTRLHAPPGGSSQAGSLIFGGGASDTYDRFSGRGRSANPAQSNTYASTQHQVTQQQPSSFANKEQYNYQSNTQQQSSAPVAAVKATTGATTTATTGATTATYGTSANAFASGTNQNCGNFITDRPTSRVLAPPGGRSSGPLW